MSIPSCSPVYGTYDLGPFVFTAHYACDRWVVPHILTPFLMTIFTRSAWFGFFMAGIGELIEYTVGTLFGSFVIFVGTANGGDIIHDAENMCGAFVEDWLIQGGLGSFVLGWFFYSYFTYPALLRVDDLWSSRRYYPRLIIYSIALFGLCITLPAAIFGVTIGSFPLGALLYPFIQGGTLLLLLWWEKCNPKLSPWVSNEDERLYFHLSIWFILLAYSIQNLWYWFYSSAVQTWFITAIIVVGWIPLSIIKWQWFQRIKVEL